MSRKRETVKKYALACWKRCCKSKQPEYYSSTQCPEEVKEEPSPCPQRLDRTTILATFPHVMGNHWASLIQTFPQPHFSSASFWNDISALLSTRDTALQLDTFVHLMYWQWRKIKEHRLHSPENKFMTWHYLFHPCPISTPTNFPFLLSKPHFSSVLLFFISCVL